MTAVPETKDRPCKIALPYLSAAAVVTVSTLFHLVYAVVSPLDLAPDEAHYWDWSRNLDFAYYSKGPLVAWLIRGSCELFGNTPFGVRFPAVICHALLLGAWHRLAVESSGDRKLGVWVVAFAATLPPVSAAAAVMTIDAPFLAAWAWAAVYLRRADVDGDSRAVWFAALAVLLGVLAKHTMLLLPALALLTPRRSAGGTRLILAAAGVLGLLPYAVWNLSHGSVGLRHLLTQAGGEGDGVCWTGPFEFLSAQLGLLLVVWFIAFARAVAGARRPPADANCQFLIVLSVPVLVFFLLLSSFTKVQPNWPAPAWVAGFVLAVGWVKRKLESDPVESAKFLRPAVSAATFIGLSVSAAAHVPHLFTPALAAVGPVRKLDPTARLRGWRHLAAEVDAVREQVACETGVEPCVAGMVWTLPGELGFYCRGNPRVYSFGSALRDRRSQYDEWRPNPVADAQAFAAAPFVYVGEAIPAGVFDRLGPPTRVEYRENGVIVAAWTVWVGYGYRGFPDVPAPRF